MTNSPTLLPDNCGLCSKICYKIVNRAEKSQYSQTSLAEIQCGAWRRACKQSEIYEVLNMNNHRVTIQFNSAAPMQIIHPKTLQILFLFGPARWEPVGTGLTRC